jgi:hypothetical protein
MGKALTAIRPARSFSSSVLTVPLRVTVFVSPSATTRISCEPSVASVRSRCWTVSSIFAFS